MVGAIIAFLRFYEIIIIIRAVQSWMSVNPRHPMVRLVYKVTEPVLGPIRSFVTFGTLDLSPVVVIVGLEVIARALGG
jgi:YggT family protein